LNIIGFADDSVIMITEKGARHSTQDSRHFDMIKVGQLPENFGENFPIASISNDF
jgi:hypothetical protein